MPTENIFTGNAVDTAQVWKVTPANVETGDVFTLTINGKSISYTATAATVANVVAGLVAAWNASTIAEFAEVTAAAASDSSYLTLTADTAGKPFIVTSSTSNTTAGAVTVAETTPGEEPVNEVQRIKLQDGVSGGTFTYANDFGSGTETTGNIAWNASADTLKAAIVALATPTAADLSVVKAADGDWYITWTGAFAASEVAEGTIDGTNLTGTGDVDIEVVEPGRGLSDEIQMLDFTALDDTCAFNLRFGGLDTGAVTETTTAAQLKTLLEALANIGSGNVEVYGGIRGLVSTGDTGGSVFFIKFTGALGGTNVGALQIVNGTQVSGSVTTVVAGGQSTANEFQVIYLGQPTAGTFTLSDGTNTTAALSYQVANPSLEAALEGFTAFDDVEVWGQGGVFGIEFRGSSADSDVAALTLDYGSLTYTTTPSVSEVRKGEASVNAQWKIRVYAQGGSFTLSDGADTTAAISNGSSAATVKGRLETDIAAITTVTVTGTGIPSDPYVVTLTSPAATPLTLTGNGASLTGGNGIVTEEVSHDAGANEVQTITIDAGVTGGTYTLAFEGAETGNLAYNAAAATIQSALEGLATIGSGNVVVAGSGPYTVTFQGTLAKQDVSLLVADGTNLDGGSGTQTLSITETTRSQGKHHFNDPQNWTRGTVAEYGETIIFEAGSEGCLYGIDQVREFTANASTDQLTITDHPFVDEQKVRVVNSGGALPTGLSAGTDYYVVYVDKDTIQLSATRGGSAINLTGAGSGTNKVGVGVEAFDHMARSAVNIGLPEYNEDGEYYEYRPRFLKLWVDSSGDKKVTIGEGEGPSANRINLDFQDSQVDGTIYQTGSSTEANVPALLLKNAHASSAWKQYEGEVGVAFNRGDSTQFSTYHQHGGVLVLGKGHVNGNITKTAGSLRSNGASVNGVLTGAF